MPPFDDVELRRSGPDDEAAVLRLLAAALGWSDDDRHRDLFRWKHRDGPFGPSPAWVAVAAGEIVGFRAFLRWEFERDGRAIRAVRAVDTAVHPRHQRQGLFARLTSEALPELRADGVRFVFNTPNDDSRPGYLKLGWQVVGRLPVSTRPSSLGALGRLARARVPAERWSVPSGAGVPAAEALGDEAALAALVASQPCSDGLGTRRSAAYLRWRYGEGPVQYRALPSGRGVEDGLAIFRLRRRGPSLETALCEVLVPGGDRRLEGRLVARVAAAGGADAVVWVGPARPWRGFVPLPGQGPLLVWRGLADPVRTPAERWRLVLGDVELF